MPHQNAPITRRHPQPTSIKKSVVIVAISIIALAFALAVISAFTPPKKATIRATPRISNQPVEISDILQNLPKNYADTAAIKRFTFGTQNNDFEELKKEFETLRTQHQQLEQELATISAVETTPVVSKNDDPAKNSSLFFAGVASEHTNLIGQKSSSEEQQPLVTTNTNESKTGDFPNKQSLDAQKQAVLKAIDNPEDIYDLHNIVNPISPYEIQAGTIIPAVLITGVNTTLTGTVVAQIRNTVYDSVAGKHLLIPKGSKILGEYNSKVLYGQRRVLIAFNRIIRPNGSSILLGNPTGADPLGQSGMEGNINNHWGSILGAATLSTILSVGAGIASDNVGDRNAYYPNSKQGAVIGAADSIARTGQNITDRALHVQPTITIPAGFNFNVIVKRDMILTPYKS